jgi:hypothetical protein
VFFFRILSPPSGGAERAKKGRIIFKIKVSNNTVKEKESEDTLEKGEHYSSK